MLPTQRASERRPFLERWTQRLVRRPYTDAEGGKGWLTLLARPQRHVVARHMLTIPGWPRLSRPLRIVLLSDLHIGSHTGDVARLERIVEEVNALAPDVLLHGGDYVNMQIFGGGRVRPHIIAEILSRANGSIGTFAILGNHDYMYGPDAVAASLRERGIPVLDHEHGTFVFEGYAIDVFGVPDAHVVRPQARALLATLKPEHPAIVLAHDPAWFAEVPAGPYLTLSGHTHGGQIKLPGLGILRNSSYAPLHWSHGHIVEDGRHLIVTAGLGTSLIPVRIGVPPEYVVIEVSGI